ncbi:MAG: chitobiase/beta-hexosaminidase C-terminal domain-containing protein, partial [Nitrospinota bacterium]
MKTYTGLSKLACAFFVTLLLTTACGIGGGSLSGDGQEEDINEIGPGDTTPNQQKVSISGLLSDTPVNTPKPGHQKIQQGNRPYYKPPVATWANAKIQAIDTSGAILAQTRANSDGNYTLVVPSGNNYFLRASLGNLVLKAFIENATADLSNTVIDPASSAVVKILTQAIGATGGGDPGTDVSTNFAQAYSSSTLSAITSNTKLPGLITDITDEIALNYDPAGALPSVGSAGNAGASIVNEISADTVLPRVTVAAPSGGATGVSLNPTILVTFSEPMLGTSLTADTFTLRNGATKISGEILYNAGSVTFTPSQPLSPTTTFTVTVSLDVSDVSGNPLGTNYSWQFTTGAAPSDVTAPTVTGTNPPAGATGVGVNSAVRVVFNEPMVKGDFTTTSFTLFDNVTPIAGSVDYTGNTATFIPTTALSHNVLYTATASGAVEDLAGNALGADFIWTFTTIPDTTLPEISEIAPADTLTGVPVNTSVAATFNEDMTGADFTNLSFTLTTGNGSITVPASVTYSASGMTVTLDPTADLSFNTEYTATISGLVTDLGGNALGADKVWTFTTGASSDGTPPSVTTTSPLSNAVGVPVASSISATFSEPMAVPGFTPATFTVNDGTSNIPGAVTYSGLTATFTPSAPLSLNGSYTATVSGIVTDIAGNPLSLDYSWPFVAAGTGPLISDIIFPDPNLQSCVEAFGETLVSALKFLNCSQRGITDLTGIGGLTALTTLLLNNNQIATLPPEIGNLTALTSLVLKFNQLSDLPIEIGNLTALDSLVLDHNKLTVLPSQIGDLTALSFLVLNNNLLENLPVSIGNLTALTELFLENNQLTLPGLPATLGNLTALKTLFIHSNLLTGLPDAIGNLTALTSLVAGQNQLTSLPVGIGNLNALTTLDLKFNQLTTLPPGFWNLTALKSLDLKHNQLADISAGIQNFTSLTKLFLDNNQLVTLPDIGNLSALVSLSLHHNQLTGLPAGIGNFTTFTSLDLSYNQVPILPDEIGNLTALRELRLNNNQLGSLPTTIANLTSLKSLVLDNNQLAGLPTQIGALSSLSFLSLNNNLLSTLPGTIQNLTALTRLSLQNNQLTDVPAGFGNLTALTSLSLGNNQLAGTLSTEIGNLSALTSLGLDNNQLAALPSEIGNLIKLRQLHLHNNQLTGLPISIGNLPVLSHLALENNLLETVPAEIGNLTALTRLFLHNNLLTTVPIELGSLDALTILNLQNNSDLACGDVTDLVVLLGKNVVLQPSLCVPLFPTTTADPAGGAYNAVQNVTLTADEPATIYYTTDGTVPTTASAVYAGPISINQNTTLNFFAVDTEFNTEDLKTEVYIIDLVPPKTTAAPAAGPYNSAQNVTLTADEAATIYYTTDGTTPTTGSAVYAGAIPIPVSSTLNFFAVDAVGNTEAVKSEVYVIDLVPPTTTATPASGDYNAVQNVTLTSDEPTTIYYTTDGTAPTTASAVYGVGISITTDTTLNFFSVDAAGNAEGVKTEVYVIDLVAPTTAATPPGGAYNAAQTVTLTSDETATIYYTTDGTTPTTASPVYAAPIPINLSSTLKYFAVDAVGNTEAVKTEAYVIDLGAPTTTAAPPSGNFNAVQSVTLTANEPATIYFTTDGTTPTTASPVYTAPIPINISSTLKYFAVDTVGNTEAVKTEAYVIDLVAPTTSPAPAGGSYSAVQNVTLTADEAATIYYTTDGTTPTTASTTYAGPISIAADSTL